MSPSRVGEEPSAGLVRRSVSGGGSLVRLELRPLPYPHRAMIAICSDLDETPDREVYWETARFLNTTAETAMGSGVGLEVGNTIYFDMPAGRFSYWNTDDEGRERIRALIRSGHVDCLHSFGDLAVTRDHARRALDELTRHGCRLQVWIDHGTAPTNFGADIMRGQGDIAGSAAFHADLTCAYGIRYICRGRVTSVIGQDVPRKLGGIYNPAHPLASALTAAKELIKGTLGRRPGHRYALHARNRVMRPATLRSGQSVYEFLRFNPHWNGPSGGDTAVGLPEVLSDTMLERLIDRGGVSILYTHLGKIGNEAGPRMPLGSAARAALRRLAAMSREGRILVASTRRLLGYCRARAELRMTATPHGAELSIELSSRPERPALGPIEYDGLTLYVAHPARTRMAIDGRPLERFDRNPPDATGRPSVSVPWRRLEFPAL